MEHMQAANEEHQEPLLRHRRPSLLLADPDSRVLLSSRRQVRAPQRGKYLPITGRTPYPIYTLQARKRRRADLDITSFFAVLPGYYQGAGRGGILRTDLQPQQGQSLGGGFVPV